MLPDQAVAFLGAVFVLFGVMGCIMLAIIPVSYTHLTLPTNREV